MRFGTNFLDVQSRAGSASAKIAPRLWDSTGMDQGGHSAATSESYSNVNANAGPCGRRKKREQPTETIKVRLVTLGTPEATEAAIGHL